ncbi:MAG: type VI secretion system contractile sheath small subunit [Verrucomicrobia bacterium]|nr:type VI secretion system contractile sheath small subunit [Verrucomicrobiota bacterium]
MATQSGQKFIKQNRAPRVQIEYDVELGGAQKKVDLPFVMGVMADLSGHPEEALPEVASRKFLEIDVDNFDKRIKATKPRLAIKVPNTLTSEAGQLAVEITFENMEDFTPARIAEKVEPLRKLLAQRKELEALKARIDGKAKIEDALDKLITDRTALKNRAKGNK